MLIKKAGRPRRKTSICFNLRRTNYRLSSLPFKVMDRNLVRCDQTIVHSNPNAIHEVITMRFHEYLRTRTRCPNG